MNLKALLASASIIATSFFVPVEPAKAGTCWYIYDSYMTDGVYCRTIRRINGDGHIVFDITDGAGATFSVVLWDDNTADVVFKDQSLRVPTYTDSDGDERIVIGNMEFIIDFRQAMRS